VLKALRDMSPQCEVALMTGYSNLDGAVDAVKRTLEEGLDGLPRASLPPGRHQATAPLVEVEREHIIRTLEQVRGNKAVAARILGISRRAFYRQLERHGLHQRVPMSRRQESTAAME
jgi:DNA-binding NtrC family response regulator